MPKFSTDFICGYCFNVYEKELYKLTSFQPNRIGPLGVNVDVSIPIKWINGSTSIAQGKAEDQIALTNIKQCLANMIPFLFEKRSEEVEVTVTPMSMRPAYHMSFRASVKRKEVPRDMTVKQIEDILGFKINIVE